jgi:hypothetical protein
VCSRSVNFLESFSHRFSFQSPAVGVVHEPIQDGVSQGVVIDGSAPLIGGQLADDHGRVSAVSVIHDLHQVIPVSGLPDPSRPVSAALLWPGSVPALSREHAPVLPPRWTDRLGRVTGGGEYNRPVSTGLCPESDHSAGRNVLSLRTLQKLFPNKFCSGLEPGTGQGRADLQGVGAGEFVMGQQRKRPGPPT